MGLKERDRLTNENVKKLFKNNFELANHAIRLGRFFIKSGKEMTIDSLIDEICKPSNSSKLLEGFEPEEKNNY